MYASKSELTERVKAFASTSYSDKTLVDSLDVQGRILTLRLRRAYTAPLSVASVGAVALAAVPSEDDTVTIGSTVYRFKGTGEAINDVTIAGTAALTAANLRKAINQDGAGYYTGTTINEDARAVSSGATVSLYARKAGPTGDDIALSTTGADITVTAFSGGAREFPELVQAEIWMTAIQLLSGQANSAMSGSANRSNIDDMQAQLKTLLGLLDSGYALTDTLGGTYSGRETAMLTDCDNYPPADMGDPTGWDTDPDRIWDRG